MSPKTFIADSAADALAQIRAQLGPDAVVLNVRQVTGPGLARLWQKPQIEVVAHVPEAAVTPPPAAPLADGLMALRREMAELRGRMEQERRVAAKEAARPAPPAAAPPRTLPFGAASATASPGYSSSSAPRLGGWHIGPLLERAGLETRHAQRIADECESLHGPQPPAALGEELALAQQVMVSLWRPAPALRDEPRCPHVFIGAPGAGKTTALCKWLAQTVLLAGQSAHVWRLDGSTANTAEALSVYGEILGVPVTRFWRGAEEADAAAISFVDLPGVAWRDEAALRALGGLLAQFPGAQVHLVLNAAYEVSLQLAQVRAFAPLGVADLCLTHLDEEPRWGKLWNLALGTNLPLRFLGAGQNIPGEFSPASAEKIFARQFAGI